MGATSKGIKIILRILAWSIVAVSIILPLLGSLSNVQQWCGQRVSAFLFKTTGIRADIRYLHLRWGGQLVLDDVTLYDDYDSVALSASRIAATIDILPILEKKYHLGSLQLNNAHITLSQDSIHAPLNIQGIIKALSSKDTTTSTPLDLQIRSLAIRHCSFKYDRLDAPQTPNRFNPNHIRLNDISVTGNLQELTNTSIQGELRRFSLIEQSGFEITDMRAEIQGDSTSLSLTDVMLRCPQSEFSIPFLRCEYPSIVDGLKIQDSLTELIAESEIDIHLSPADFRAFVPDLYAFTDVLNIKTRSSLKGGMLEIDSLRLSDNDNTIHLSAEAKADILTKPFTGSLRVHSLTTSPKLADFLKQNLARPVPSFLENLGQTKTVAVAELESTRRFIEINANTSVGVLNVESTSADGNSWQTHFSASDLRPDQLFAKAKLPTDINLRGIANLSLPKDKKTPAANIELNIENLRLNKQVFNDINLKANYHENQLTASLYNPNEGSRFKLNTQIEQLQSSLNVLLDGEVYDVRPHALGLTKTMKGESISSQLSAELTMKDVDHIQGYLSFDNLTLHNDSLGDYNIGDIILQSDYEDSQKELRIINPLLNTRIDGSFAWRELVPSIKGILHTYMPSFFDAPTKRTNPNNLRLLTHIQDTILLQRALGVALRLPSICTLNGQIDSETGVLDVAANLPEVYFGKEHFSDISFHAQTTQDILHGILHGKRHMAKANLDVDAELFAADLENTVHIAWHGNKPSVPRGSITAHGLTYTDDSGNQAFRTEFEPSTIIVGDTLWYIQPGSLDFHKGSFSVKDVGAYSEGRYLRVNGKASSELKDTMVVELKDINVAYVLGLVNFHSVEFDGDASGSVWACNVLSKPQMNAHLDVRNFTFNEAPLGDLTVLAEYGRISKAITLNANIIDTPHNYFTRIDGVISFDKPQGGGLDLNVQTKGFNLAFLKPYTHSFSKHTEGRASGWARIFGPFSGIDLEGDLELNNLSLAVDPMNTTYSVPKDSIHLRPGIIYMNQARVLDERTSEQKPHFAYLDAQLTHERLSRFRYNLNIDAHNFLAYNHPELGAESFCGTAIVEGAVSIRGGGNVLNVDVSATPIAGSTFTYNATQPDKITEANFIRFKKAQNDSIHATKTEEPINSSTNIYLNLDLNLTPQFAVSVIMDSRSGDHIDFRGEGHLNATYYNKGSFQLFGTYQVTEGRYDLSIQDFLHKEFNIQQGSNIVFSGNPSRSALDIRAAYTVPNVSMQDLSTSGIGLPNTRVDCIMHISGQPRQPSVTFDFELPTANEEERQMVRSLLSTEEERNLQVIYLLGIGRFINMDGTANVGERSSQSQMAVNGIVSSTISSQFNRVLSSLLGNSNWNFGTNLRTGQMGWDNVDVEGVLSGKLFNNRLLINGNFGYRERFYNSSNFIGDFDVKYLITPTGSVGLKAYNKSNDRYFIQSSLNTQGIGIQFKKDFTNFFEIFGQKRKTNEAVNNQKK